MRDICRDIYPDIIIITHLYKKKQIEGLDEIALRLGIYNLILGTFTIKDVLKLVKNANNFSDISERYKKIYKIEEKTN